VPASKLATRFLMDRFEASVARWSKAARDRIRRELTVGLIRGETVAQMAARLQGRGKGFAQVLSEKGSKEQGESLASGLWRPTRYEATRIVRTEVLHAYNEHAHDQLKQLRDDDPRMRQQWCAVIDGRTCKDCFRMDGEVVDIGEPFPGCLRDEPPLHPFCRCCRVAWRADWPTGGSAGRGED
jgi:SPP1 gp7 family putative phage head morphogenesis protein